jgi:prepilin-type processing-associated H-X9-DG protein
MIGADPAQSVAENYRRFGRVAAAGKSPLYTELCEGVANDPAMLEFLSGQPPAKRQPNLLLAGTRFLFGLQPDYPAFRARVLEHRDELSDLLGSRRTQTNEPGRCAALLPVFGQLPQPLALLEVGAAAGLCLLIDRYGYDYGGRRLGDARVVFECAPHGPVPVPEELPDVVWRAGIDLEPIDLDDADAVRWLETLVWPEEQDRLDRLRAAIEIAREQRPRVIRGNLLEGLHDLAAEAPHDATLVIFHTAVLAYLTAAERERFVEQVRTIRAEWISNEGDALVPGLPLPSIAPVDRSHFVIAAGGRRTIAFCDGHGSWLQWL